MGRIQKSIICQFVLVLVIGLCGAQSNGHKAITTDICVYGDSEASFMAAIAAARSGKSVSLISPSDHIGGFIINGLSSSDIGDGHVDNKRFVSGLPLEFYKRITAYYGHDKELGSFGWEPHVAEEVIENWLKEFANISVYKSERLKEGTEGVLKDGAVIRELAMESGTRFKASVFIDATIEGDLMAFSGVSYAYGREGNVKYGETINGVYPDQTYRQFEIEIDPYIETGNPSSGLLPTILNVPLGSRGDASPYIMGFCFRICLTDSLENRIPISKPKNYDSREYEIYRRYFKEGGMNRFLNGPYKEVPNAKTDMGSWHDLSANLYGMNVKYLDAGYKEREEVYNQHKNFTIGLLWFLQNDSSVPEEVQLRWLAYGLPKDEFLDNGHWPNKFYARSSRRMVSDYVVTEHNGRSGAERPKDPIGVTLWPFDMHAAKRIVRDGKVWNEGFVFDKKVVPFGISYRALVPKKAECTNLLVAACPSSSYVGYSALRLVWVFMTMGQASGVAAVKVIDDQVSVQDVAYDHVRLELLQMGQVLDASFSD